MPHPLHDLVAQPIEQLARRVENILDESNQAQILGPKMLPALGTGPPRALVKLALLNDCLRVIESAVAADRATARDKVEAVYPLLKAIAAVYARVRRDYQPFARLTTATVSRFLRFHYRDSRVFGNACEKTRWLGRDICHRAAALGRDPDLLAAYERMTGGLMQHLLHPTPAPAPPPAPEIESEEVALGAPAPAVQPPGEQGPTSSAIRRYEGFNVEDSDDQIALAPPPPSVPPPEEPAAVAEAEEPVLAEEEPVLAEEAATEPPPELAEAPPAEPPDEVAEQEPAEEMPAAPAEPLLADDNAAVEEAAESILLEEEAIPAEAEEPIQEAVEPPAEEVAEPEAAEEVAPPFAFGTEPEPAPVEEMPAEPPSLASDTIAGEVAEEILLEEEAVLAEPEVPEQAPEPIEDLAPIPAEVAEPEPVEEAVPPPASPFAFDSEREEAPPVSAPAEEMPSVPAEPPSLEGEAVAEELAEEILLEEETILAEPEQPAPGQEAIEERVSAPTDEVSPPESPAFWPVDLPTESVEPEATEAAPPPLESPFAFDSQREEAPAEEMPVAPAEEVAEEILLEEESILAEPVQPPEPVEEQAAAPPDEIPPPEAAPFWPVDLPTEIVEPEPAEEAVPPPESPFAFDSQREEASPVSAPVEEMPVVPAEEAVEEILLEEEAILTGPEEPDQQQVPIEDLGPVPTEELLLASPVPPGAELEDVPLAMPVWLESPPEEPVPSAAVVSPETLPEETQFIEEEAEAILLEDEATLAEEPPAAQEGKQVEQAEADTTLPGEEAALPFAPADLFTEAEEVPLATPVWPPPEEEVPLASGLVEPLPLESEPVAEAEAEPLLLGEAEILSEEPAPLAEPVSELEPASFPTADEDLDAAVAALLAEAEVPPSAPVAEELPAAVETAEDHARRGATLRLQGDHYQAVAELEEAIRLDPAASDPATSEWYSELALARAERGEPAPLQALECYHLGRGYAETHALGAVLACLEEAAALDPRLPWAPNELARHLATWPVAALRDGPAAVRLATTACELGGDCWVFLDTLAAAHAQAGNFKQAVTTAEKALGLAPPEQQADVRARLQRYTAGQPLPGSGASAGAAKLDPADAEDEAALCRTLAALEARFGLTHPRTVQGLAALGRLCHREGRYREASCLLKRAVRLEEKSRGRDEALFAESLHLLGDAYWRQERYAEAVPCYEQALDIRQKVFGPDDPDVVESIHHLGRTYARLGRLAEAETLYRQALALREQTLGPDHPEVANVLCDLAELQSQGNRAGEARSLFQQALAIRTSALGSDHEETARVQTRLQELEAAGA
jgi:tetratricopeptide (TPR) repeat protein